MSIVRYHANAERPTLRLTWYDDDDALIDFSSGYTWSLKVGNPGSAALLTKTSGITGAATAPNVTIAWTAGELALTPGTYTYQLTATTSALDRTMTGQIQILDVVS
jgi:hypothetical protein